jgi:uncharacterized protein (DUF934 family)
MRIIKDRAIADDAWTHIDDDVAVTALLEGDIIVRLARWRRERDALLRRGPRLGVRLASADRAEDIADDLAHFEVVAIEFPKLTDGRGFSTARLLRERFGYQGEIRAVGEVLRDQLYYMYRCGFDAFEIRPPHDLEDALAAFAEVSVTYQPAIDDPEPLWRRVQPRRPLLTLAPHRADAIHGRRGN